VPPALAIVHTMQGRLRLRLPPSAEVSGLLEAVRAVAGVTEATWNPRTHGLLVRYRSEETTAATIIEVVAAHTGIHAPASGAARVSNESVAAALVSSVSELNGRVARATGGRLDLGVLVPLALTAWAARELLRAQIAPLAWSSALWYAHGLFRDYALRERS
jgi:hypothetical protein